MEKRRKCTNVPQSYYICEGCAKKGGRCPNRDKYVRSRINKAKMLKEGGYVVANE